MSHNLDVVGLGYSALDILIRLGEFPTWEKGARLDGIEIDGGGPVATALVAAQRLGLKTGFIGTFGNDRMGRIKLETLVEHGVDTRFSAFRENPEDQVILVSVNSISGERVFSGKRHSDPLKIEELDREYITSARILHLDGFHTEAALQAAVWMRHAGKMVMLDGSATRGPVSEMMRELVSLTHVLICGSGFGYALSGKRDLYQAGEAMLQMGPEIVVQTEGKDGSYTCTRQGSFHTAAFEVDVIDTTGAGDVFHGAYLVGMLKGWDVEQMALFSSAVSAMKCSQLGGRKGIPDYAQVIKFLNEKGIVFNEYIVDKK